MATGGNKTPPHSSAQNTPKSTPLSQGTASNAQLSTDMRAGNPLNMKLVERDIKKTETVPFYNMMIALIARMILGNEPDLGPDTDVEPALAAARGIFEEMLVDALDFVNCNLVDSPEDTNQKGKGKESRRFTNSQNLKDYIKEYCNTASEKRRYSPLANALNAIMMEYRDRQFSNLPTPIPSTREGNELIYIPNDPQVIQSDYISRHFNSTTKRKPDVISVYVSLLRNTIDDNQSYFYADWVTHIYKDKYKAEKREYKPTWKDVQQTWELKASKKISPEPLLEKMEHERMLPFETSSNSTTLPDTALNSGSSMAPPSEAGAEVGENRKRQNASDVLVEMPAKRARNSGHTSRNQTPSAAGQTGSLPSGSSRIPGSSGIPGSPNPPLQSLSPDVQCAFYAIERLHATWTVTHSTVVLLQDSKLTLWWYDPQGCIKTTPIDIVRQLPLFVVMTTIFQRFDDRMWGLPPTTISHTNGGKSKTYKTLSQNTHSLFELVGRRTFGAEAVEDVSSPSPTIPTKENGDSEDSIGW
ncbi:hypothetical protein AX16_010819 [Volvariella volvacea WC 439]|nr:hypothetical protein AX16_010819 [Volvariella volvacea WC 439]